MSAAYFENHPTDPEKMIMRKPKHESTWVGLTDEDKFELAKAQHGWEDLLIAAEAKLKEKNT